MYFIALLSIFKHRTLEKLKLIYEESNVNILNLKHISFVV